VQSEALRGKGSVTNGCAGFQAVPASECGTSCAAAKAELGWSDGKWTGVCSRGTSGAFGPNFEICRGEAEGNLNV
jgi:hypothetical protein